MGEILSQAEIDKLLSDLAGGNAEDLVIETKPKGNVVREYDFAKPSKFNKEQLRTLEIIFDNYARLLSSFLTAYLRTSCNIEISTAEQITYKEFDNAMVNPVILGVIEFKPLKGSILLEMSSNIGYSIIDRILGGPGLSMKKIRDFSEIEKILLDRVISQMIGYLVEPWENVVLLQPALEKIETNSQFAQIISPNEMIVLASLNIKIGTSDGYLNFCLPHFVLEPIMERLNTKFWFAQIEADDEENFHHDLEMQLEKALIPVSVVLGNTMITVNDFINLQVGDIIPLDSYISNDLSVMVGNLKKFNGKPGIVRGKMAVSITSLTGKEE